MAIEADGAGVASHLDPLRPRRTGDGLDRGGEQRRGGGCTRDHQFGVLELAWVRLRGGHKEAAPWRAANQGVGQTQSVSLSVWMLIMYAQRHAIAL